VVLIAHQVVLVLAHLGGMPGKVAIGSGRIASPRSWRRTCVCPRTGSGGGPFHDLWLAVDANLLELLLDDGGDAFPADVALVSEKFEGEGRLLALDHTEKHSVWPRFPPAWAKSFLEPAGSKGWASPRVVGPGGGTNGPVQMEPSPYTTLSMMAWRSMAMVRARRTFTSLKRGLPRFHPI